MKSYKNLDLVDHSGLNRILKVYDKNIFKLSDNFLEVVFPFQEDYLDSSEQDTIQDTIQVKGILKIMDGEFNSNEIMEKLNLKNRAYFQAHYLQPAIKKGYLEMTIPDKPNSKFQRYKLTELGIIVKNKLKLIK